MANTAGILSMNEVVPKTDTGANLGKGTGAPVASPVPEKPAAKSPAGNVHASPLPPARIGEPGYKFAFPAESPQGQEERREHERLRKASRRAASKPLEPPPLPAPPLVDAPKAPVGQPDTGLAGAVAPVDFVPWVAGDICDFTDELVELSEARRVSEFVAMARDAKMPAKFVAEIERTAVYPVKSKAALKRSIADVAAKWLNKTGVSSKNKEEVKLLFCAVTIKMQGVRLKRDLLAVIEEDRAKRAASDPKPAKPETASVENPPLAIVK